jgi:F0F1-type ATP synthase assembly protein I
MDDDSKRDMKENAEVIAPPKSGEQLQKPNVSLIDVINVVAERVDPLIQLIRTFAETNLKRKQSDSRFRIHMTWIAVVVVGIIVGVATLLTFTAKMDGSAYGFLLGTITGYCLTFIRDAIRPNQDGDNG